MNPALEIRDLSYSYPDGRRALDEVDLTVGHGERVAVLGPNGAGKTTLALHINGILRAADGHVAVDGIGLDDDTVTGIRRRVGLVFQDADDQLFMPTVAEDVAFGPANLGLTGQQLDDRVDEALDRVDGAGLADRVPHHLSGGEKRVAAIATALAMHPSVLVLDEPTAGLDPVGRRELAAMLLRLDVALIVITHDLPLALEVCSRAVILDAGRIVSDGPTSDLLADPELLEKHRLALPFGFEMRK